MITDIKQEILISTTAADIAIKKKFQSSKLFSKSPLFSFSKTQVQPTTQKIGTRKFSKSKVTSMETAF